MFSFTQNPYNTTRWKSCSAFVTPSHLYTTSMKTHLFFSHSHTPQDPMFSHSHTRQDPMSRSQILRFSFWNRSQASIESFCLLHVSWFGGPDETTAFLIAYPLNKKRQCLLLCVSGSPFSIESAVWSRTIVYLYLFIDTAWSINTSLNLAILDSDNDSSPIRHRAISWTNNGLLSIGPM